MTLWSRYRRKAFRKPAPSSGPQRQCRLVLECLEERWLLSGGYAQVNLASDVPGLARITDSSLVNPWGITFSPTGPFWFANNGNGVAALLDGRGQPLPLLVSVASPAQSGGTPTGAVFNGGPGFRVSENGVSAPGRFVFASADGTISAWSAIVDWSHAVLAVDNSSSGAVYKGLALATDPAGNTFLYAADFGRGTIDVFDQNFKPAERAGFFQDPNIPDGFAPFNIRSIHDLLFVTYAQHGVGGADDLPGAGHGFIDVYDTDGNLVKRLASQGPLNSPWGLALAPPGFGPFGGALLVGNNGDGLINAYDPQSGAFLGTLAQNDGTPIVVSDLWALTFGNGHLGGAADTLFFTAGVDNETHGLFGAIQAPQRIGADTAGPGPFDPHAPGEPGDYPLPPASGPIILDSGSDLATADLLPTRESSLALIPTLVTAAGSRGKADVPVSATPFGSGFLQVTIGTASPVARSTIFAPLDVNAPASETTPNSLLALNTILDLIIVQKSPANPARGEQLELISDEAHPSLSIVHDAKAANHLPESQMSDATARLSRPPTQETPAPSRHSDEPLTAVRSDGRSETMVNREPQSAAARADDRTSWMDLLNPLVVIVSIPMICAVRRERGVAYERHLGRWSRRASPGLHEDDCDD
jgi:uncharacterized protein (TIGR03118 family)